MLETEHPQQGIDLSIHNESDLTNESGSKNESKTSINTIICSYPFRFSYH